MPTHKQLPPGREGVLGSGLVGAGVHLWVNQLWIGSRVCKKKAVPLLGCGGRSIPQAVWMLIPHENGRWVGPTKQEGCTQHRVVIS